MLIPSIFKRHAYRTASLSRRVNANSQLGKSLIVRGNKLIKKGEC